MPTDRIIKVRDAKKQSLLPAKLRDMKLLGSYQGKLYLGSEYNSSDTIIFGYSISDDAIIGAIKLNRGAWPESWTQKDNLLFVGTRFGDLTAVDMETCEEVGRLENLGNAVDSIAVNGHVYFGVNGKGLYKSDTGLTRKTKEKKEHVVSALTLREGKLFAFYFSNGNDPLLDGGPAGGLVEVLDENLKVLSKRNGTPYAVTQAINTEQGLRFSTRDTSNGWIQDGEGGLHSLQPDLSDELLLEFPAAVNILRKLKGTLYAGLKNGTVFKIEGGEKREVSSQRHGVTGLVSEGENIYIGSPNGKISRVGV